LWVNSINRLKSVKEPKEELKEKRKLSEKKSAVNNLLSESC
jgi:hypothetical protein